MCLLTFFKRDSRVANKENKMKRKSRLLVISVLVLALVILVTLVSVARKEALVTMVEKIVLSMIGAGLALLAQFLLYLIKSNVFGSWSIEIFLNGEMLEGEKENLSTKDAEIIIKYDRAWWLVFFLDGLPSVRKDLEAEQLLRSYCASLGLVRGDVRNFVTIDKSRKVVTVKLTPAQLIAYVN